MLQILLDPGPPEVHQGRQGWHLLADLGPGSVTGRELMPDGQRFDGLYLRVQAAGDLRRRLWGRVDERRDGGSARGSQVLPIRALHLGPARDFSAACRHQQGALRVGLAPWARF